LQEVEITLFHLPKPTKHHLDTLEQLLTKTEKEVALMPADLQARAAVAAKLDKMLKLVIPGWELLEPRRVARLFLVKFT
jgi:hypothetical protein